MICAYFPDPRPMFDGPGSEAAYLVERQGHSEPEPIQPEIEWLELQEAVK